MFALKQASWILLGVGVGALILALLLFLAIRRIRRRYREGKDALTQLRAEASTAHLGMQATLGTSTTSAGAPSKPPS